LCEERPSGSFEARCGGEASLHRVDALHRRRLAGPGIERRMGRLRRLLHARLAERERAFRVDRYDAPARSFIVRAELWRTTDAASVRCVRVDESTDRSALGADGWMWSGRGVTARGAESQPLSVRLEVPAGVYAVDAPATPIPAPPWLFGLARWRRKAFLPDVPSEFPPLRTPDASRGEPALDLPAAPDSVFAQTDCPPFEVVLVDDASTDDTAAVVAAARHPIVYVRHERNRGVAQARQTGVERSRAPLLAFHDSDDMMLPGRLGELARYLDAHPDVGAVFSNGIVWPDGHPPSTVVPPELAASLDG